MRRRIAQAGGDRVDVAEAAEVPWVPLWDAARGAAGCGSRAPATGADNLSQGPGKDILCKVTLMFSWVDPPKVCIS